MNAGLTRRAGPLFGAWLVAAAVLATLAPAVPAVSATDPTPDPSATAPSASPSDAPSAAPSAAPAPTASDAASPSVDPSVDPSLSPSPNPSASVDPSPSIHPSPSPVPSAIVDQPSTEPPSGSPGPSPSVAPSASPSASLSPTIQVSTRLLALAYNVDPTSPHIVSGLTSDTCAACHASHGASEPYLLSTRYRSSPLRLSGEAYSASDFGLCYSCHTGAQQTAIEDTTGTSTGTNFPKHGFHLQSIGAFGSGGTDIGVPGDGQGNALCAECHYNLHGTSADTRGLVKFAPDVVAYNGLAITYDATTGTCTLTCHGEGHDGAIVPAP